MDLYGNTFLSFRNEKGYYVTVHNLFSGSWLSNCYVLISRDADGSTHAAVVDPSSPSDEICEFLESIGATLDMIIMTHGHFDHIMSLDSLRERTGAPAYIHESDAEMLSDSEKNAYSFFFSQKLETMPPEHTLRDGDILTLGDEKIKAIHLPGHSKGSIALLCNGFILTGDTLFDGGIGRCDLYGGNMRKLYSSLGRLKKLDPSLKIYPGHGNGTTLGHALDSIF